MYYPKVFDSRYASLTGIILEEPKEESLANGDKQVVIFLGPNYTVTEQNPPPLQKAWKAKLIIASDSSAAHDRFQQGLKKGDGISVSGTPTFVEFAGSDGTQHIGTEIYVREVTLDVPRAFNL